MTAAVALLTVLLTYPITTFLTSIGMTVTVITEKLCKYLFNFDFIATPNIYDFWLVFVVVFIVMDWSCKVMKVGWSSNAIEYSD